LSPLQEIRTTRSCLRGAGRCPVVSRGDTLYGFGARPGVCTEAAVHGPCREDPKEATRLPARNTPARTAHLTAQSVSLIGEGIAWWRVTVWWKRCWFKKRFQWHTHMTVSSKVEFGEGALHFLPNACVNITSYIMRKIDSSNFSLALLERLSLLLLNYLLIIIVSLWNLLLNCLATNKRFDTLKQLLTTVM